MKWVALLLAVLLPCSAIAADGTMDSTRAYCNLPPLNHSGSVINITIILGAFIMYGEFCLDDLFALLLFCVGIPTLMLVICGLVSLRLGKDIWTLEFDDITAFGVYFYYTGLVYFPMISLLRMPLLFFYLCIFIGLSIHSLAWANAAISIALDLWMLAIPPWCLKDLNLHWKKIGIAAMFIMGTFITVISIIRLKTLAIFGLSSNLNLLGDSSAGSRNYHDHVDGYHNRGCHLSRGVSTSRPETSRIQLHRSFKIQYVKGDEAVMVTSDELSTGAVGSARGRAYSMSETLLRMA
ncbi:hypothetical protein EDB81DRAFT_844394 [Dactylonectria macrodidyma]|uniref:Rhodopsin domain-containing protein n=1 Tax=Dactylonectria macrodidyma TaxID=307937 RepID=A0A9P9IZ76_9HYPO|nr:hypothetical protein EDB81DRAFT_844394 [Dactylonectria macrodidyma]